MKSRSSLPELCGHIYIYIYTHTVFATRRGRIRWVFDLDIDDDVTVECFGLTRVTGVNPRVHPSQYSWF